MKTHYLEFNGYSVGDRLLEDVIFLVEILEDNNTLTLTGNVKPDESAYPYIDDIRWEKFVPSIIDRVQSDLDHLLKYWEEAGQTVREGLEEWATDSGMSEISVLTEV